MENSTHLPGIEAEGGVIGVEEADGAFDMVGALDVGGAHRVGEAC